MSEIVIYVLVDSVVFVLAYLLVKLIRHHRMSIYLEKNRSLFKKIIADNKKIIQKHGGKNEKDAEYAAICILLEDLMRRHNRDIDVKIVMDLLPTDYKQHYYDVLAYCAYRSGEIALKPEREKRLLERLKVNQVSSKTKQENNELDVVFS